MIPLLTPTMESELLKESWITLKMKPSPVDGEDNSQNFSVWEENFQDLSGWCMDQFPEQCDFPIGEAINPKLSDMRYENEVSTFEEEVPDGFTIVYDKKTNCDEDILQAADLSNLQSVVKFDSLEPSCTFANKPDAWLNATTVRTIETTSNAVSAIASNAFVKPKPGFLKLHIPPQQIIPSKSVDPLEPTILSTSITNEPESFDLLTYLCDDEVALPSASTCTVSPGVFEARVKQEAKITPTIQNVELKLRKKKNEPIKKEAEPLEPSRISSPSLSSSSSTYLEESTKLSERIEKSINIPVKPGKNYHKGKRRVKRKLNSESENEELSDSTYRESREKNNEASRKSRMNKKAKETEMAKRAVQLEKDNKVLKMKVEELEKLVTSMHMALLQSAMKKER